MVHNAHTQTLALKDIYDYQFLGPYPKQELSSLLCQLILKLKICLQGLRQQLLHHISKSNAPWKSKNKYDQSHIFVSKKKEQITIKPTQKRKKEQPKQQISIAIPFLTRIISKNNNVTVEKLK
jgi:hypothetical protein